MGRRHLSIITLTALLLLFSFTSSEAGAVGVNYGRVANNLPSATKVVQLLKSHSISQIKLYDADPSVNSGNEQYEEVRQEFIPRKKKHSGHSRLDILEQEMITIFLNSHINDTPVWQYDCVSTTKRSLFALLEGKELVTDDVMGVFVCIMQKFLRRVPYPFKKCAALTRPGALFMSGQPDACETTIAMIIDAARNLNKVDIVILPIAMYGHFHVVVLDTEKKEFMHYSSCDSDEHKWHATQVKKMLDYFVTMEFGRSLTLYYPLIHDNRTPRPRRGTVDCAVYVMRFVELILEGEKLRIPQKDVPYLRLKYVARILVEARRSGLVEKGESSTGGGNLT